MATSDNVVRAGLTPKLRDVPNLIAGLTYTAAPPTKHMVDRVPLPAVHGSRYNKRVFSQLYSPPVPEFSVVSLNVPKGRFDEHPAIRGPSIAIVTAGHGTIVWNSGDEESELAIGTGRVLFIGANTSVRFRASVDSDEGLGVFRVFVEVE